MKTPAAEKNKQPEKGQRGERARERGISPEILLSHVENTAPWLLTDRRPLTPYTQVVLEAWDKHRAGGKLALSHGEYFALCLCAHYSTVATFVPTDVDNQIREHLWKAEAPEGTTERMAELVLQSLQWDFRPLTTRFQEGNNYYVCGHQGEWFSVAVGAYGCHRVKKPELAAEIREAILKEARAEAEIFGALKKAKDGVGLLRASTAIAHNLGDLNRVFDQWDIPGDDPLALAARRLGHERSSTFGPLQDLLLEAGALNKAFMASENHRHFPLRKPKCLRLSIDLLLPLGPFFDAWGETVARHPALETKDKAEVAEALLEGFHRLSSPKIPAWGYARALRGMQSAFPGGPARLLDELPSRAAKEISRGLIPEINRPGPQEFASNWAKKALHFWKLA
jgi:hypothetical protein